MFKDIRQNGKSIVKVMKNGSVIWQKPRILPEGYIECEYLENAECTQYIDTQIIAEENDKIMLKISAVETTGDKLAFGIYPPAFSIGMFGSKWRANVENTRTMNVPIEAGKIYVFSWDGGYSMWKMDGVSFGAYGRVSTGGQRTLWIFARNYVDTSFPSGSMHIRLYAFTIKRDGKYIMNLIPCLDNLGVPCMYDTVSKSTFYNQGTGTFGYKTK